MESAISLIGAMKRLLFDSPHLGSPDDLTPEDTIRKGTVVSAPTSDLMRYAIVRPPRREAALRGARTALEIAPSDRVTTVANDAKQADAYLAELAPQIAPFVGIIETGTSLLRELATGDNFDFADNAYLGELRKRFQSKESRETQADLLAKLGDQYAVQVARGRLEEAAVTAESCRAVHAVLLLPNIAPTDLAALANSIILLKGLNSRADGMPKRVPPPRERPGSASAVSNSSELVAGQALLAAIDTVVSQGFIRVEHGNPGKGSPPSGGDEQTAATSARSASESSLVATVNLRAKVGEWAADVLDHSFDRSDWQKDDVIRLRNQANFLVTSNFDQAVRGRPVTQVRDFARSLAAIIPTLTKGQSKSDIDEAVSELALGLLRDPLAGSPGWVEPRGIADLKVVRQQLQRYELGEIAYIENVLKGEKRARKHHYLERVEQTLILEEETASTTEKDLQTTERFELSDETSRLLDEKKQTQAGINVSASYGVVSVSADARMINDTELQQSQNSARKYARETIAKASERLERRSKRTSSTTTTVETVENNEHSFEGRDESIAGIYRWVDKHFWCQSFNYGARLSFEVQIPEPAAYYLYALASANDAAPGLSPPSPPSFTAADIMENTYRAFAAQYGASVSAPPPAFEFACIGTAQGKEANDNSGEKFEVEIPAGYEMIAASPIASCRVIANGRSAFEVLIAPYMWQDGAQDWYQQTYFPAVRGKFVIGFNGCYVQHFSVSVNAVLQRTAEAYEQWQLNTYEAIQSAYLAQKSDYERKIATSQARRQSISERTDQEYRAIERMELKRAAIQFITGLDFSSFGSMQHPAKAPPYIDIPDAVSEGTFIRFIEESFEWDEMVYNFYPYFWGGKTQWDSVYSADNQDPVFERFLRAGSSKVIVTVKPGSERRVLYYVETGQVWSAEDPPLPADPAYLAMITEIESIDPDERVGRPEGAPWKQVVPTTLVCLETEGAKLPSWEIDVPSATSSYAPSTKTCRGEPYNINQWPDDRIAVLKAFEDLGYGVPETHDPIAYFNSGRGSRMVQAFQHHVNNLGIGSSLGGSLVTDGQLGPCTLRALTIANAMNLAGKWPKQV